LKTEKPIINVIISDTHCGSDRAVFPPQITLPPLMADDDPRILRYSYNQEKLYKHLIKCAKHVKENFKDYKKVVIHNGDAIEGIHHHTIQLSAPMIDDHVIIHCEVMDAFLRELGFSLKNGDELHYVSGTESHTGYTEARIVKYFSDYKAKYHDELKLTQYNKKIWFVHQWVGVGNGQNEGNPINNGLKAMYFNSLKEGWQMPDVTVGSHFHKASSGSYTQNWKTHYGMITPSFQMKTRFGQKVSAFQRNDIGIGLIEVFPTENVKILEPLFMK